MEKTLINPCNNLIYEISEWNSTQNLLRSLCISLQLNEYEADPYFLQLSQNMATNCLVTFIFSHVLTWIYLFCVKNCSVLMFRTIFGAKEVNSGKNRENTKVNKQSHVIFWLNWRKYGAVSYSFSCTCQWQLILPGTQSKDSDRKRQSSNGAYQPKVHS